MTTEFIEDSIWARLTNSARSCRGPAVVAVAYFSEGAAALLPLRKGSGLVVDASEGSVKAGQTCPADLIRLQKKGVRIFSVQNLHAKVYVFGTQAFIGSANVSNSSANRLKEAMILTTERDVVKAARAFIQEMCVDELGPESLKVLQQLYRRPHFPKGKIRRGSVKVAGTVKSEYSPLRLVKLSRIDYPEGSETAYETGKREANSRRTLRSTHVLEDFSWPKDLITGKEMIVQITREENDRIFVSAPGRVLKTKKWSNGRKSCTFVYLEVPKCRRIRVDNLAKRLGRDASKRLNRSGLVASDFADKLREAWRRKLGTG